VIFENALRLDSVTVDPRLMEWAEAADLGRAHGFLVRAQRGAAEADVAEVRGAETVGQRSLSAWSWWCYEPFSEQDLVFSVATYARGEVGWVCRRAGLPKPAFRVWLPPGEPGFAEAIAQPFKLIWMPLDEFARGADRWRAEEELRAGW
jgi:hypothetical protein